MGDHDLVLAALRDELDKVDVELVACVSQRLRLCRQIAILKRQHAIPMMQPHRVQHVKDRASKLGASQGLDREFVQRLYQLIIDEACRIVDTIIDEAAAPVSHAAPLALKE